jgi:hypothetical protein
MCIGTGRDQTCGNVKKFHCVAEVSRSTHLLTTRPMLLVADAGMPRNRGHTKLSFRGAPTGPIVFLITTMSVVILMVFNPTLGSKRATHSKSRESAKVHVSYVRIVKSR